MPESGQSPQQIALQRLLKADTDAVSHRQQARQQADAIIADGEAAVQQLRAEIRAAAEEEAATYRRQADAEIEAEIAQVREHAQQELEQLQQRAQSRIAAGVATLIAWVKAQA